mgnify:CR=1 FL=1|tara:strand:+ start:1431 stop:1661 length:231 start_codon:yes stop_codon:yes gene_type:complete
MFENRKYTIIDISEVGNIDFDEVLEYSADTLRYNLAGTKAFVKWEGETPAYFFAATIYTHAEILEILNNSEWNEGE